MPELSPTVARSISEAVAASGRLLASAADHALTELQSAETQAEADQRQHLAEAWRELHLRRKAWQGRFPGLLRNALEEDARGKPQAPRAAPEMDSGFLSLTLVDDTEIARTIEASRLAQQLASMLERPLAELDGLMSSALGLQGIQPERNPLRPAVFAKVLRELMGEDQADAAWPALWLRSMVKPLAQELEQLYRAQTELLTGASVHAADYRLVTVPSKGAPMAAATVAPASAPAPATPAERGAAAARSSGFMDLPVQAVDGLRLRLFLARDDPQARQPVDPSFRAHAEAELRTLEQSVDTRRYDADAARRQTRVPVVERAQRAVDTDSPLPEAVWGGYSTPRERSLVRGRLRTQASDVGQVFGLEVVRRLINKVAEDPRLLAPVREAIVALEPSLSRLAMVAPRFFSDEAHPGRLLVERVAERSFKYNDEFSVEFQGFLVPVAQTFTRLNEIERFDSAIPFQAALAALQAGWRAQDTLDEEAQRKVLEAVQFAERRQHEAERVAAGLRERPELLNAPLPVQEFVLGTWSVVIAHARLADTSGEGDPGGHLAVVGDLLWSVDREAPLRAPARAFVLIPRMLMKLREGLASLGQSAAEGEPFWHQLEQLHRPVLKLRAKHRHRDLAPPQPPAAPAQSAQPQRRPGEPWMPVEELRAAGFEDTLASDFTALPLPERPLQQPAAPLAERESEELVAALVPGCWVDLYAHQQWRRARLVWAAGRGTLFMFVSHGGQPHSMTRRTLQRLARQRLLRVVASEGVVPRALEKLGQPSAPMPLAA